MVTVASNFPLFYECCLNPEFNPMAPWAFCQKGISGHFQPGYEPD